MTAAAPKPWESNIDHSVERLRAVLRARFPGVAADDVEILGAGWDNTAALVDGRWVFRFARRPIAAELMRNECAVLPGLADRLPLAVPVPVWIGEAGDDIEFPLAGYERLSGTTACSFPWTERTRVRCAAPVGAFLGALHGVKQHALPDDAFDRTDLEAGLARLVERAGPLRESRVVPLDALERALSLAASLVGSAPSTTSVPVHGDLYARHILVDPGGVPTGVIDWGDVHRGDPALDLSFAYSFLPPAARAAFFTAYGRDVDEATHARARFRAVHYGVILSWFGADIGDEHLIRAGRVALEFSAAGGQMA